MYLGCRQETDYTTIKTYMKKLLATVTASFCSLVVFSSCSKIEMDSIPYELNNTSLPTQKGAELSALDLERAMALTDTAVARYFTGANMTMLRYYNPVTRTNEAEVGSVWMYTSAIEAVNSVMISLKSMQKMLPELYTSNYNRYEKLLEKLYEGLDYYAGSFTLTSYTGTKKWRAYAVDRAKEAGTANMDGILNVYDDQEWLIREMVRSYRTTGNKKYLDEAENLTSYVLDGWDCNPDANGGEVGGITWGPGYVTKHACSNGPMIAPLVWLYENYRGNPDQITYKKIDLNGNRYDVTQKKSEYYLEFAKKIYAWQKKHLLMDSGVYYDLIGASADGVQYDTIKGTKYRKSLALTRPAGKAYTYNSGTMLSGGAALYRVTRIANYLTDVEKLTAATFNTFAKKDLAKENYYSYPVEGFDVWFNNVLLRGYTEAYPIYKGTDEAIATFQNNLDYGWANYLKNGILPTNLLVGWSWTAANNKVEGMFTFAYAAEYAELANYQYKVNENK